MATTSHCDLDSLARNLRGTLVEMSHRAGTPHLASALSCVDILLAAHFGVLKQNPEQPEWPHRDRFILSKGHAISALYAVLASRGYFSEKELESYNQDGGRLSEQPFPGCMPGVELATGSLGHGLPVGLGMALAAKIQKIPFRVFVVVSDGECNEGSLWEAALLAPTLKLSNLAVIVDFNKWQATGRSEEIMTLNPLVDKWRAFGWQAHECDGHNRASLQQLMSQIPDGSGGKPLAIVAHTIKGKGVSFMENDNNWHYRSPTADEVNKAKRELGLI